MTISMAMSITIMISATNLDDDFNHDWVVDNYLDAINGGDNVVGDFHEDFDENLNDYSKFPTMISRTISITIMIREN